MALENRQPYIQQPAVPQQPEIQRAPSPVKKRSYVSLQEKIMYVALVCIIACFAISILNKQADIQTLTIDIQKTEAKVDELSRQNVDLKIQVSELSNYDRILEKAQALGLTLNENNVKVVPGQ